MLERSKEYWRKKAQEEFLLADNERSKQDDIEKNQFEWNKRMRESAWVMSSANDQQVQERIDHGDAVKITRKYGEINITSPHHLHSKEAAPKPKEKKNGWLRLWNQRHKNNENRDRDSAEKVQEGGSVFDDFSVDRVGRKVRFNLFAGRQEAAHDLYTKEENDKRAVFLKDNFRQVLILRRVKNWLTVPRQPTHHVSAEQLPGYDPQKHSYILSDEEKEKLRASYPIPTVERINETLRPLEDVIAEENEANRFKVVGLHHRYRGAEKIFPLKNFPDTVAALIPPDHIRREEMIPEHHLLPNPVDEARKQARRDLYEQRKLEKRKKIRHFRRQKVDLARVQVQELRQELSATQSFGEKAENGDDNNLRGPPTNKHFQRYRSRQQKVKTSDTKVNSQFRWRRHVSIEENSVYSHQHHLSLDHMLPQEDSMALTSVLGSLSPNGQMQQLVHSTNSSLLGSGVHFHLELDDNSSIGYGEIPDTFGEAGEITMGSVMSHEASMQQTQHPHAINQYNSVDAVRSNVFSHYSVKPLVRIKLERHRHVKKLNIFKIKGGLNMISLRTKEKLAHEFSRASTS